MYLALGPQWLEPGLEKKQILLKLNSLIVQVSLKDWSSSYKLALFMMTEGKWAVSQGPTPGGSCNKTGDLFFKYSLKFPKILGTF